MKIAYVFNQSYFMGGGERSFSELIRCISKEKVEPIIVVPDEGEIAETYRNQSNQVFVMPFPPLKTMITGRPLLAVLKLARWVKDNNINIIHANGSRACLYSGLAGRLLGVPVIWHVRETIRDIYWYDALLGSLAHTIVCASESVKNLRFGQQSSKLKGKCRVVYNSVDSSKFCLDPSLRGKIREELGVSQETILFGIIGNIIPLKGHDFFLKGLELAVKKNPALQLQVVFAGRALDPDFEQRLRELAVQLHLENNIIFSGFRENVVEILSALDVFVLPSQREGFSRSLLEAMSMGLPIIASKINAIEEAVNHEESALLVEFGNVEALAHMIQQLSTDETLRKSLGDAARERVERNFSLETHSNTIEKIYEDILSLWKF